MDDNELEERISLIATRWSVMFAAHRGPEAEAQVARQWLMQRYCGAVYRYLLSAVRDPHAADDLTQEFALRFVRGLFRGADPGRGRFRDYVKTALFHLVDDYRKKQQRNGLPLSDSQAGALADSEVANADQAFLNSWRDELLARTWKALAKDQEKTGQLFYTVLRLRVEHPDTPSLQLAEQLTAQLGRSFTATAVRQLLHRARERFADLLLRETARSLQTSSTERLEQELAELNLLKYCEAALKRRVTA
jgi:RNA polymerase sigma-70 factor (ECF subfamily)